MPGSTNAILIWVHLRRSSGNAQTLSVWILLAGITSTSVSYLLNTTCSG
jgi:hypothetical protein